MAMIRAEKETVEAIRAYRLRLYKYLQSCMHHPKLADPIASASNDYMVQDALRRATERLETLEIYAKEHPKNPIYPHCG
jgi:hypothetical protein